MKKYIVVIYLTFFTLNVFGQNYRDSTVDNINLYNHNFFSFANFEEVEFFKSPTFAFSKFLDTANFILTHFSKGADFQDTHFFLKANFFVSRFNGKASFYNSNFSNIADFGGSDFSYAYFGSAIFSKGANFSQATFSDNADFSDAYFGRSANFSQAYFSKEVYFRNSHFSKSVNFVESTLKKGVNFRFAKFKSKSFLALLNLQLTDSANFIFDGAVLPDTIYFGENNLSNDVFFINADFTDSSRYDYKHKNPIPIHIYLFKTDITKLHFDYIHFKLFFPDSTIQLKGSSLPKRFISFEEKSAVYEALLIKFKNQGQTESYELLDIDYQQFKIDHNWPWFIRWLPGWWWNFGYDKDLVFKWTALFLFIFTAFTYIFIYSLNSKVYAMEKIPINEAWAKKLSLKDFNKRLWFSFMYTATVFFKLSVKVENLEFKERRGTAYIILVYTVGLICIAYMANFVIQKG